MSEKEKLILLDELIRLEKDKYTGTMIINWHDGRPKKIKLDVVKEIKSLK